MCCCMNRFFCYFLWWYLCFFWVLGWVILVGWDFLLELFGFFYGFFDGWLVVYRWVVFCCFLECNLVVLVFFYYGCECGVGVVVRLRKCVVCLFCYKGGELLLFWCCKCYWFYWGIMVLSVYRWIGFVW